MKQHNVGVADFVRGDVKTGNWLAVAIPLVFRRRMVATEVSKLNFLRLTLQIITAIINDPRKSFAEISDQRSFVDAHVCRQVP